VDHYRAFTDRPKGVRDPVNDGGVRVDVIGQYGIDIVSGSDPVEFGGNGPGELTVGVTGILPDLPDVVHRNTRPGLVGRIDGRATVSDLMLLEAGERRKGAVVPQCLFGVPRAVRRVLAEGHETLRCVHWPGIPGNGCDDPGGFRQGVAQRISRRAMPLHILGRKNCALISPRIHIRNTRETIRRFRAPDERSEA
jgi:hypothetical protein